MRPLLAILLASVLTGIEAMRPMPWVQRRSLRERLALAPSPFAVAQSFSPRVFDNTLSVHEIEETLQALSQVTITVAADGRLTDFVLAAVHMEPSVAISFVRSSQGLRLVAYGSKRALQSIVATVRRHENDAVNIVWQES